MKHGDVRMYCKDDIWWLCAGLLGQGKMIGLGYSLEKTQPLQPSKIWNIEINHPMHFVAFIKKKMEEDSSNSQKNGKLSV